MIMQCPDYDDNDFEYSPSPVDSDGLKAAPLDLPGFLYRGVPQDHRCRTLRIDATGVHANIPGPRWLAVRHESGEFNVSELFFG